METWALEVSHHYLKHKITYWLWYQWMKLQVWIWLRVKTEGWKKASQHQTLGDYLLTLFFRHLLARLKVVVREWLFKANQNLMKI